MRKYNNNYKAELEHVINYHEEIMVDLFLNKQHQAFSVIHDLFNELIQFFKSNLLFEDKPL